VNGERTVVPVRGDEDSGDRGMFLDKTEEEFWKEVYVSLISGAGGTMVRDAIEWATENADQALLDYRERRQRERRRR